MTKGSGRPPSSGAGDESQKRVTLKALAEHLSLSPATISVVLNDAPVAAALECLAGLDWEDYAGQVVEFLEPDSRKAFGSRSAWDELQTSVFEGLQRHA